MPDIAAPWEDLEKGIPDVTIVQTATNDGAPDPEIRLDVPTGPIDEQRDVGDTTHQVPTTLALPEVEAGLRPPGTVRIPSNASSDSSRRLRKDLLFNLGPRQYHKWKSPLLMLVFYICGLGMSVSHCALYVGLNNSIVGGSHQQGTNLRQASKPFTFALSKRLERSC
jgi:hypothetical protein